MAPTSYLERLRARLRDFTREHGVLGHFHDDRLFDELNELERMIGQEERRAARSAGRLRWPRVVPSFFVRGFA